MQWTSNEQLNRLLCRGCRHTVVALVTVAAVMSIAVLRIEARAALMDRPTTVSVAATRRVKVGGSVTAPRKVTDVRPEYPDDARDAKIEGVVILGIVIGADGSVIETTVLRSVPALDQAAVDAVTQWEFEPTLLNGEPVEVEMAITVNFTLQ
jgi:TonB family protein